MRHTSESEHPVTRTAAQDRTVIAWDGSPASRAALDWAVLRAVHRSEAVVVARIVDAAMLGATSPLAVDAAVRVAMDDLDAEVRRLAVLAPDVQIGSEIVKGHPAGWLKAMSNPTTLLVVGASEHPLESRPFAWRLSSWLSAAASGPVAIIPASRVTNSTGIIVAVDGTDSSRAATMFAAEEARQTGEPLVIVHAWLESADQTISRQAHDDSGVRIEQTPAEVLASLTAEVRRTYPDLEVTELLVQATAADAIVTHARTASLLVMGARGYGPVRGLMLGSVSAEVLAAATCPVVLIGPVAIRALIESSTAPGRTSVPAR